jgi:hypothetical protein
MLNEGGALAEEVIRAKRFEVADNEGNVRALTAAMDSGGVATNLFDSNGNPRVSLGVNQADVPTFGLYDADGTVRVDISSGIDGQIVRLNDENGNPRALMALMTSQDSAPNVMLLDKEGNVRVQLQLDQAGVAAIGFNDEDEELQVGLGRDHEGKSMLLYRDAQGNRTRAF